MHSRVALALFCATAVLAKKGGSSQSIGDEASSTSSSTSPDGDSDSYFYWSSANLSEFVLALIYGVVTLFGGGYWLAKRYKPAMTAAGLTAMLSFTWATWGLSIIFYILSASWTGTYAHGITGSNDEFWEIIQTPFAAFAFESISTVAWMSVLLGHTYILWRTLENKMIDRPERTAYLFYATLAFLVLSLIFGGIIRPAVSAASGLINTLDEAKTTYGLHLAYTTFTFIAACLLLATVHVTRKTTRAQGGSRSFDPLRWVLLVATPLWVITEFVRFLLAVVTLARLPFRTLLIFEPSLLLFGIASLATIAVLPSAAFNPDRRTSFHSASW
ncbi:hypothetical protein DL96DRAFT_1614687 [Flagelloscypha sp. PMI_526]|nr:hypothetical protein DL96DRAFT_1614687 [Flagelloscypha sp. PMI_526]